MAESYSFLSHSKHKKSFRTFSSIIPSGFSIILKKPNEEKIYSLDKIDTLCDDINKLLEEGISISLENNNENPKKLKIIKSFLDWKIKQKNFRSYGILRNDVDNVGFWVTFYLNYNIKLEIYDELEDIEKKIYILSDYRGLEKYMETQLGSNTSVNNFENIFRKISQIKDVYVNIENDFLNVQLNQIKYPLLIVGKNGAGKTRLMKYIAERPESLHFNSSFYLNESCISSFDDISGLTGGFFNSFKTVYAAQSYLETRPDNQFVTSTKNLIWDTINKTLKKYGLNFSLVASKNGSLQFKIGENYNVGYKDLSSGEKTLFVLISWISFSPSVDQQVALLDEIETTLHADSLHHLFEFIKNTNFKVIISTHSATTLRISGNFQYNYCHIIRNSKNKISIEELKSYEEAVSNVSGGKLSVIDDSKLVFVEDTDDKEFYTMVYSKLFTDQSETRLVFCEIGSNKTADISDLKELKALVSELNGQNKAKSIAMLEKLISSNSIGGGCTRINARVKLLSQGLNGSYKFGNSQVMGLIDSDNNNNQSTSNVIKIKFYSVEMYFCLPLVLYYLKQNIEIKDTTEIIKVVVSDLLELIKSNEHLKGLEDKRKSDLSEFKENLNSQTVSIKLVNGDQVQIPCVFVKGIGSGGERGHALFETLALIYCFEKGKKLGELFIIFKTKIFAAYKKMPSGFIPNDLKDTLKQTMCSQLIKK